MSRIAALAFALLASLAVPALADYDAEMERREAAQREAAAKEEARLLEQAAKLREATEQRAMRGYLGAEAEGKSDAEVRALYEAKLKGQQQEAEAAAANAPTEAEAKEMERRAAEGTATVEEMTGKSIEELESMSDEEAAALQRELEKKHGGQ